jgi:hypothetical protein
MTDHPDLTRGDITLRDELVLWAADEENVLLYGDLKLCVFCSMRVLLDGHNPDCYYLRAKAEVERHADVLEELGLA